MNFYDNIVHYSEVVVKEGIAFIKGHAINFVLLIMLIWAAGMSHKAISMVRYNKLYAGIVSELENHLSIKIDSQIKDVSYEVTDGVISSNRLIGDGKVYYIHIKNEDYTQPYIFNQTENVWLTPVMDIPPLLSKAFIHYNVGLVEKYDEGIATINGEEYGVDFTSNRINIGDYGIYAPMPPQTDRAISFIENYIPGKYTDLELLKSTIKKDREILYAESDNTVYSIHILFNGSVKIGTVTEGINGIKEDLLVYL